MDNLIPENTIVLSHVNKITKTYIIGTTYVSGNAAGDIRKLIKRVKPKHIFLDICSDRKSLLDPDGMKKFKKTIKSIKSVYPNPLGRGAKYINGLEIESFYTKEKIDRRSLYEKMFVYKQSVGDILFDTFYQFSLERFNMNPMVDMKIAAFEGIRQDASIILGDRPIHTTFSRVMYYSSLWSKISFLFGLVYAYFFPFDSKNIKIIDEHDIETTRMHFEWYKGRNASLIDIIIKERDMYMSSKLRSYNDGDVVAVVGIAHLKGIQKYWNDKIDIEPLLELPTSIHSNKGWVISVTCILIILFFTIYNVL